jgi:class 3 adenylate cyclase
MFSFRRLSLQSKLILVLLLVGLSAIAVVTWTSYRTAEEAATEATRRQLVGLRVTKANLIRVMLANYRDQITSFATSRTALESLRTFTEAAEALPAPTEAQRQQVEKFYREQFLPGLERTTGERPQLNLVMPGDGTAQSLQALYVAGNPHPYEQGQKLEAADDASSYTEAHKRYHGVFAQIAKRVGLDDLMLVDGESQRIVYTYQKTAEIGTSLADGPYANTNLAAAVRAMLKAGERTAFQVADFELYRPNLGRPAAFYCTPIFEGARVRGVAVYQLPIDEIVRVMTGDYQWAKEGMGETGEVYLVGPDYLMRSRSRFMKQDPKGFLQTARAAGYSAKVVQQLERQGSVILALPVRTPTVGAALEGKDGVEEIRDYRNEPVLSAYAPLDFENIRWAVIAEMDTSEAFGPVRTLAQKAFATAAGLSMVISLLAFLIASVMTKPIRALTEAARRVAAGELDVQVQIETQDEVKELGDAFNQMTRTLKRKTEDLEATLRENEELLLNILPAPAAARLKEGDDLSRQSFADVTVLIAEVMGLERAPGGEGEAIGWLHQLVVAFDEAAERHGVEKLKTVGSTYVASCGLSVARPDHPQRALEFAEEMLRIVARFGRERNVDLEVDVGLNAGPVTGGVIGRKKFIYDLWGETVSLARFMKADGISSIRVTQTVYERLQHQYPFERQADVPVKTGAMVAVYQLNERSGAAA